LSRTQNKRTSARQPILLDARCRKTSWFVNQVELVNVSEGGCCICGRLDGLAAGDEVTLRLADLGAVPGSVRWVEERRAGIAFASPLAQPVVDELAATYTAGTVKPTKDGDWASAA
jgi:hypothetical protein